MGKRVGKYELGRTLGEGTFGKVKFATNTETGEMVAIKVLDKERIAQENMGQQIKKEIAIMKIIKHRYVVQLREVLASKSKIFIVLELVTGGELFDLLVTEGRFTEAQARHYFRQLIEGVEYCHSQGICHRDLKPENLLLDANRDLKISDFGLSALYTGSGTDGSRSALLHTTCGTPNYVAPEVLADKGYDGRTADVWSCGVILFVMLAGFLPFDESTLMALFARIQRAEFAYPSWFSPQARSLLDAILVADPSQRATIAQIKQHPWFMAEDKEEKQEEADADADVVEATHSHHHHHHHHHNDHQEHCCSFSPPPPPPPPPPARGDHAADDEADAGAAAASTAGSSPPPPHFFPQLGAAAEEDSWLFSQLSGVPHPPCGGADGSRPVGSRRLLHFGVSRPEEVRMVVDGVVEALKDMDCEVRIKEGVAAATGIHKIKAMRLTPKGLIGAIFEIHDPFFPTANAQPAREEAQEAEGEEERAYQRLARDNDEGKEDGQQRQVLVEVRRGKGDILAFRQFYHDFRKHHLPPLMPPLLHASATTSAAEAHLLESIFSSAPGAK